MYAHHSEAIENALIKLRKNEKIKAVILCGSIAHGFASENSDIDLMLVLSESDYQQVLKEGNLKYIDKESANYPQGYIDGKYISEGFIQAVAEKGSEPARFAFQDAQLLYSDSVTLADLILAASRYPKQNKDQNMEKFYAQFEGWNWMYYEGLKRDDIYVITYSITNLCLFAGRLLLAYNELLYPYHKWFLKVLSEAKEKPQNIVEKINQALLTKKESDVKAVYEAVKNFYSWPQYQYGWSTRFVIDSEINWINGAVPIADL